MPRRRSSNPWMTVGFDAWMLGAEAASVIALRTMKVAAGGAAATAELDRMVAEKAAAAAELQMRLLTGRLGLEPAAVAGAALRHVRRKVRANRRRLVK